MNLSNYLENKIIDRTLRNQAYTPASTVYLALFTALSDDGDTVTEVTGGDYARQAIAWSAASSVSRSIASSTLIAFPVSSADYGTVTHIGIYDAASSGNLLAWRELSSGQSVPTGDSYVVPAGDLTVTLAGGLSDLQAAAVLDHIFRNQSYTPASATYLACLTAYTDDSTLTEVSNAHAYARVAFSFSAPSAGEATVASAVQTAIATGSWGTVTHVAIYSSGTHGGGTLLWRAALTASKSITSGRRIYFPAGDLKAKCA